MAIGVDMKARDIMIRDVITASPDDTVYDLVELLKSNTITGTPVVDNSGKVVGVVSVSDILRHSDGSAGQILVKPADEGPSDFCTLGEALQFDYMNGNYAESVKKVKIKDIMKPFTFHVSEEDDISTVANTMVENRLHRVIVMKDEKMSGIICTREFIKLFVSK